MDLLEKQIGELEQAIREVTAQIRPLQQTVAAYRRQLKSLKDEHERITNPEAYRDRKRREYISMQERKLQVKEILEARPNATNIEIGRELKVSPARISQIRKELGLLASETRQRPLEGL